jgi:hypothetical protein
MSFSRGRNHLCHRDTRQRHPPELRLQSHDPWRATNKVSFLPKLTPSDLPLNNPLPGVVAGEALRVSLQVTRVCTRPPVDLDRLVRRVTVASQGAHTPMRTVQLRRQP